MLDKKSNPIYRYLMSFLYEGKNHKVTVETKDLSKAESTIMKQYPSAKCIRMLNKDKV
jgi:hypothetical protein